MDAARYGGASGGAGGVTEVVRGGGGRGKCRLSAFEISLGGDYDGRLCWSRMG